MNRESIVENISKACTECGSVTLLGSRLEDCPIAILDVRNGTLDEHLAVQSAALPYYGQLLKDCTRELSRLEKAYSRWTKKKYAETKTKLKGSDSKITVGDIEAQMVVDCEAEIEAWEKQISDAEAVRDDMVVWYEAWKQKSYSISLYHELMKDEMRSPESFSTSDGGSYEDSLPKKSPLKSFEVSKSSVREIMRKRKEVSNNSQKEGG